MPEASVLIVEDERFVAHDIEHRLKSFGYGISAVVYNAADALTFLSADSADICILDIGLKPGMDGIKLAHEINRLYRLPLIFLTALSDDLTVSRAKDARPAAFMLKPFQDKELQIAIELALSNFEAGKTASQAEVNLAPGRARASYAFGETIFIRKKDRFNRIDFKQIRFANAQSNYTRVNTTEGDYTLAVTLKQLEEQLKAPYFLRIHRSNLVNLKYIDAVSGNRVYIGERPFDISRNYRDEFFRQINMI